MIRPSTPVECKHDNPDYIFDANGWKRWCSTCQEPLNYVEDPGGDAIRGILFGLLIIGVLAAAIVAFYLLVNTALPSSGFPVHPSPIPAPAATR